MAAVLWFLAGCHRGPEHAPAIGQAYVGPATLKIRSDIPLQSATVATVKHGDRLELLQRRRIFLRVRTPNGAEGWTEVRQLLSASDMDALKQLAERAAKMPAQGKAMAYADLNVHTQPALRAPSLLQIKAKEKFDVLGHVRLPQTDLPRAPLIPPTPKKPKGEKKPAKQPKIPPPPMPKPPPLPQNWLELSKTELEEDPGEPEEAPVEKPVPVADWSLIRTPTGQTGWVLTRRISMAIPDEVAQYAEGRRIVSYFSLGQVSDEDQKKDIWLWTTIGGPQDYDFDSFRVFVWSLKRHRYETAYIERNIQGYAPVHVETVDYSTGSKSRWQPAVVKYPGFSLCVVNSDGQRVRRTYALLSNIVRYAGEGACEIPPPVFIVPSSKPAAQTAATAVQQPSPAKAPEESFWQRLKKRFKGGRK